MSTSGNGTIDQLVLNETRMRKINVVDRFNLRVVGLPFGGIGKNILD